MQKFKTPSRFTPFFLEHKKREGSLCVRPGKVMELSDDDISEMRKIQPKIARKLKALPAPKRPAWAVAMSMPVSVDEAEIDFELKALCEGCDDEFCPDCED